MVTRSGHSLVEMVVALVFLGASLTAITGTAVLAARRTVAAVRLQEATAQAETVLDSLAAGGRPESGQVRTPSGLLEWEPVVGAGGGVWLDVRVLEAAGGDTLVILRGAWIPGPPLLPERRP